MPTLLAALEIMTAQDPHRPVMVERTLEFLIPRGGIFLDATVGYGGHAEALLDAGDPDLTLVGMDRDAEALDFTRTRLSRFGDRVTLVKESFSNLSTALDDLGIDRIDGALFDLGMSSPQVDEAERGFGWTHPGPLDMRMDRDQDITAANLVNHLSVANLQEIFESGKQRPTVNQIELSPFLQQRTIADFTRSAGIHLTAYCPLARGERFSHRSLQDIAEQTGKTPAQIMIRWGLQQGQTMIPKSVNPVRICQNADVFDFTLSDKQMRLLAELDEGFRFCPNPLDQP